MSLDPSLDRPLYKQLADLFRGRILSGELAAGARLPSKAELAAEHGVSITGTVEPALDLLKQEGFIRMQRGKATEVLPVHVDLVRRYQAGRDGYRWPDIESAFAREHGVPWSEFAPGLERRYSTVLASAQVSRFLELAEGTEVVERTWLHRIDGVPIRLARSYVEKARFGDTVLCDIEEPPWPGGTIAMLAHLGHDVRAHRISIRDRDATDDERAVFNSAAGLGVLEQWRVHLAGQKTATHLYGRPVEAACHVWPARAKTLEFYVQREPEPWAPDA
jgi:GntR family transcriptional regulator